MLRKKETKKPQLNKLNNKNLPKKLKKLLFQQKKERNSKRERVLKQIKPKEMISTRKKILKTLSNITNKLLTLSQKKWFSIQTKLQFTLK
jgi:hypothetical protein